MKKRYNTKSLEKRNNKRYNINMGKKIWVTKFQGLGLYERGGILKNKG